MWSHLDLEGVADADLPRLPSIQVRRSVREGGDTKTRLSRRTLRLPDRAVDSLRRHLDAQNSWRSEITDAWQEHDLVFCTRGGLPLDPANVRRSFRAVVSRAGLNDQVWTPRELRHSFVSLMSDAGVPLEDISRLVGHRSTIVTESVYRKQLRPVLTHGTEAMDRLFRAPDRSPDRPDEASKTDP
jgi:site-specific recombinase XerD